MQFLRWSSKQEHTKQAPSSKVMNVNCSGTETKPYQAAANKFVHFVSRAECKHSLNELKMYHKPTIRSFTLWYFVNECLRSRNCFKRDFVCGVECFCSLRKLIRQWSSLQLLRVLRGLRHYDIRRLTRTLTLILYDVLSFHKKNSSVTCTTLLSDASTLRAAATTTASHIMQCKQFPI